MLAQPGAREEDLLLLYAVHRTPLTVIVLMDRLGEHGLGAGEYVAGSRETLRIDSKVYNEFEPDLGTCTICSKIMIHSQRLDVPRWIDFCMSGPSVGSLQLSRF